MSVVTAKSIKIEEVVDFGPATIVRLHSGVEAFELEGYLVLKDKDREIRVGPFTHSQAETVSDDMGYLAESLNPELKRDRKLMRKDADEVNHRLELVKS